MKMQSQWLHFFCLLLIFINKYNNKTMGKYLKKFDTHTEYETYINGSDKVLPNVSLCATENEVHYNQIVPPSRVITAVFNIPTTANPISLTYENGWNDIESVVVTSPNGSTFELSYSDLVQYDSMEGVGSFMGYQFNATGNYTFEYTLKPNVDTINGDLFSGVWHVTNIEIPNCITKIDTLALVGCRGLVNLKLPNTITSIGDLAFDFMNQNSVSITIEAINPPENDGFNCYGTNSYYVYVPSESLADYQASGLWNTTCSTIQAIPTI